MSQIPQPRELILSVMPAPHRFSRGNPRRAFMTHLLSSTSASCADRVEKGLGANCESRSGNRLQGCRTGVATHRFTVAERQRRAGYQGRHLGRTCLPQRQSRQRAARELQPVCEVRKLDRELGQPAAKREQATSSSRLATSSLTRYALSRNYRSINSARREPRCRWPRRPCSNRPSL